MVLAAACFGCGPSGYTLAPRQTAAYQPQQQVLAAQNQELQNRAHALDRDNQELEALLAQSRQQLHLLKDELTAVREQLRSSNEQLTALRSVKQGLERKTKALVASVGRRTTATIRPNNSLLMDLSFANLPGIEVRQDGDVIRVEMPADKLFEPGGARLTPAGQQLIQTVASQLVEHYPRQIIGVEGHTETNPIRTTKFATAELLSVTRAMAVFDDLTGSLRIPTKQLFVTGHGSNHPVVSNATTAGRARNRRVELVVYPETWRN